MAITTRHWIRVEHERHPMTPEQIEVWRPVVGYEGYYECSNYGRVRGVDRVVTKINGATVKYEGKVLYPRYNHKGYLSVCLSKGCKGRYHRVHRIVATAFISEPPSDKHQVNHIDGNKANNHVANLEWVTASGNIVHAYSMGLSSNAHKERVTEKDVLAIREAYSKGEITQRSLAIKYGVCYDSIWRIINRKTWTHI